MPSSAQQAHALGNAWPRRVISECTESSRARDGWPWVGLGKPTKHWTGPHLSIYTDQGIETGESTGEAETNQWSDFPVRRLSLGSSPLHRLWHVSRLRLDAL